MFKRVISAFLTTVLLFSLAACQRATIKYEKPVREIAIELETSELPDFTLPENYVVPKYNGKLIAGERPDSETFNISWPTQERFWESEEKFSKPTKDLKQKMDTYSGQDVWFRVIIKIWGFKGNKDSFTEETLNYLKSMGGYEIKPFYSSEGNNIQDFEVSLTEQMIKLLENKYFQLFLGQYPRNPEHSVVISDSLSIKLDRISDNESIEIAVVCAVDRYNMYGEYQYVTVNKDYNNERFKPFQKIVNSSLAEYNIQIENYLSEIFVRNNITEKIVISDNLPRVKIHDRQSELEKYIVEEDVLTEFCVGFNAELTKAEILKLAEDSEIKVIYLVPQISQN